MIILERHDFVSDGSYAKYQQEKLDHTRIFREQFHEWLDFVLRLERAERAVPILREALLLISHNPEKALYLAREALIEYDKLGDKAA
jgi:hypothetical protein